MVLKVTPPLFQTLGAWQTDTDTASKIRPITSRIISLKKARPFLTLFLNVCLGTTPYDEKVAAQIEQFPPFYFHSLDESMNLGLGRDPLAQAGFPNLPEATHYIQPADDHLVWLQFEATDGYGKVLERYAFQNRPPYFESGYDYATEELAQFTKQNCEPIGAGGSYLTGDEIEQQNEALLRMLLYLEASLQENPRLKNKPKGLPSKGIQCKMVGPLRRVRVRIADTELIGDDDVHLQKGQIYQVTIQPVRQNEMATVTLRFVDLKGEERERTCMLVPWRGRNLFLSSGSPDQQGNLLCPTPLRFLINTYHRDVFPEIQEPHRVVFEIPPEIETYRRLFEKS